MKVSNLLYAVTMGKWAMMPQYLIEYKAVVEKLLSRGYSAEEYAKPFSETNPIKFSIAGSASKIAASSQNSSTNPYDDCPDDSIGIFCISGAMLKYGTMCSHGTMEIADAMREAIDSGKLSGIIIDTDSGGGSVDAISPVVDVIKYAQSKGIPVVACVDLCASAAYYFACQCDEIIAGNSISSEIGSIGVMMSFRTNQKQLSDAGIEDHTVYSNLSDWKNLPYMNAINGAPDEATRYNLLKSEELDPLAKGFQNAVMACRPKLDQSVDGILAGRMFFAAQAVENGLIDAVGGMDMAIQRCKDIRSNSIINKYLNQ